MSGDRLRSSAHFFSGCFPNLPDLLVEGLRDKLLWLVANNLLDHLAAFENQQRRNTGYAITHRGGAVRVHIHLADLYLALIIIGQFLDDRRNRAARAAPCRPEVHENRLVGFQYILIEVCIRHFDNSVACHFALLVVNVALSADALRRALPVLAMCMSAWPLPAQTINFSTYISMPGGVEKSQNGDAAVLPSGGSLSSMGLVAVAWGGRERLDIANKLPALWFRELGPDRHSSPHHPVGQKPEQGARSGLLDLRRAQAGPFSATIGGCAMTLGTVQLEKLRAGRNRVSIALKRIASGDCFHRRFRQLRVYVILHRRSRSLRNSLRDQQNRERNYRLKSHVHSRKRPAFR